MNKISNFKINRCIYSHCHKKYTNEHTCIRKLTKENSTSGFLKIAKMTQQNWKTLIELNSLHQKQSSNIIML